MEFTLSVRVDIIFLSEFDRHVVREPMHPPSRMIHISLSMNTVFYFLSSGKYTAQNVFGVVLLDNVEFE